MKPDHPAAKDVVCINFLGVSLATDISISGPPFLLTCRSLNIRLVVQKKSMVKHAMYVRACIQLKALSASESHGERGKTGATSAS